MGDGERGLGKRERRGGDEGEKRETIEESESEQERRSEVEPLTFSFADTMKLRCMWKRHSKRYLTVGPFTSDVERY